jgi:spore coat protein U-like protein
MRGFWWTSIVTIALPLHAAELTSSATINAQVDSYCEISTQPLVFSAYDPVVTHYTTPYDAEGYILVACIKGTIPTIELDLGNHSTGTQRRMRDSTTHYLNYELYQNSERVLIWGTGSSRYVAGVTPSKEPRIFSVYGRIFPGQNVSAGHYTDFLRATVYF